MSMPPITFEDDHSQHWFPTRTGGPTEISMSPNGYWMGWGFASQPSTRTVQPWGKRVDPVNGRAAACSDYPHPEDTPTFFIDTRIE